jgi:hypothetical protein
MQKLLPRMGANRIAKQRLVVALLLTVMSAVLLVGPSLRQIRNA